MTYIFFGLLIFLAHVFNAWFSRRRIPDVLLLMVIGLAVGPATGLVSAADFDNVGPFLGGLTLLTILFDSGVDLNINTVHRFWTGVVQVTFLCYFLTMAAVTAAAYYWMHLQFYPALLFGVMVSGTAAAIVIPLVRQMKVSEKTRVTLTLESAISGVLSIILSLAIIEGCKMGSVQIGPAVGRIFSALLMALLIGTSGGIVWSTFMDRIRRKQHSLFLTPAFVSFLYGFCEVLGFSGAIAALAFGIVLGNHSYFEFSFLKNSKTHSMTPLQDNEKSFFKELIFLLKTFYFVYIGICIPFNNLSSLLYGAGIALLIYVLRFLIIFSVGRRNTLQDRLTVSMMVPKGLVAAVLASIPEQVNLAAGSLVIPGATLIKNVTYSVIFFSIIICSLLVLTTSHYLVRNREELIQDHTLAQPWGEEESYEG